MSTRNLINYHEIAAMSIYRFNEAGVNEQIVYSNLMVANFSSVNGLCYELWKSIKKPQELA